MGGHTAGCDRLLPCYPDHHRESHLGNHREEEYCMELYVAVLTASLVLRYSYSPSSISPSPFSSSLPFHIVPFPSPPLLSLPPSHLFSLLPLLPPPSFLISLDPPSYPFPLSPPVPSYCLSLCFTQKNSHYPDWDLIYDRYKIMAHSSQSIKSPLLALPYGKPPLTSMYLGRINCPIPIYGWTLYLNLPLCII